MSIETLLTIGLALAILVVAAVLRFLILGVTRSGFRVSGREIPWALRPARYRESTGGTGVRAPIGPRVATGARGAVGSATFLVSAFVEGLAIAVLGTVRALTAIAAVGVPRLRGAGRTVGGSMTAAGAAAGPRAGAALSGLRRASASALARLRPALVIAIATLQHLGRVTARRTRARLEQLREERSTRPGEPTAAGDGPRVIELDREFDPLTDDFPEDRIRSSI